MKHLKLVPLFCLLISQTCKQRNFGDVRIKSTQVPSEILPLEAHLESNEDQFLAGRATLNQGKIILPTNLIVSLQDPLLKQMQFWADKIDTALRKKQLIAHSLPKPRVAISIKNDLNAESTLATLCFDLPIQLPGSRPENNSPDESTALAFDFNSGSLEESFITMSANPNMSRGGRVPCHFRPELNIHKKEIISKALSKLPQCIPQWKNDILELAQGCFGKNTLKSSRAHQIQVPFQQNWVVFHSELLKQFSEADFVALLAHELAHYYKAHLVAPSTNYGFFYILPDLPQKSKPVPDMSLAPFVQKLMDARRNWASNRTNPEAEKHFLSVLSEAHAKRVSMYSFEQEADEFALDMVHSVLNNTSLFSKFLFNTWKITLQNPNSPNTIFPTLSIPECQKLYGSNLFKDKEGRTQWIPEGEYSHQYHQPCFRIFNAVRYSEAHGYPLTSQPQREGFLQPALWDSLKSVLNKN